MRQAAIKLCSLASFSIVLQLQGCCCPTGFACQKIVPGGNNPIHGWAGTNNLKLTTKSCETSSQCGVGGPTGFGPSESFCVCAATDHYNAGTVLKCHAGGTELGAVSGHCAWQVKEIGWAFVCVANTKSVCSDGTTIVTCNVDGTGWNGVCP